MNILITGVAGFIGSNLLERLLSCGHKVVGVDNLSHGNFDNISDSRFHSNFEYVFDDVQDFRTTDIFDVIVHLASEKIPRYSNSFDTIDKNHKMISNVCHLAVGMKAKLIFASTSDIYGKNELSPFKEEDLLVMGNTNVKRWAYAVSKMHSEHFIISCHDKYEINYTILRFFSCYGKNQSPGWWGGVQSAFMDKIIAGEDVEIHGNGMQARCFTYIDDAIDGIMSAISKTESNNQIFNIGNPDTYITVYGLYKLLIGFLDKTTPVKYIPYAELGKYEDAKVKIPDITKARDILGFNPKWSLYDGLKKTIEWKLNKQI